MDEPALIPRGSHRKSAKPNIDYLYEKHVGQSPDYVSHMYDEYVQACERSGAVYFTRQHFFKLEREWRKNRAKPQYNPGDFLYCRGRQITKSQQNDESGISRKLFVATAPYSEYSFACVCEGSQKATMNTDEWMRRCAEAYRYFGGVHRATSCRSIQKPTRESKTYGAYYTLHAFASHYKTVLFSLHKHGGGEQSEQQEFWSKRHDFEVANFINKRLKDLPCLPTPDLRELVSELLEEFNSGVNARGVVRREDFEANELPKMMPLPASDYDMSVWGERIVGRNYHFSYKKSYYSVPYRYAYETILIRASQDIVEAYRGGELIARHPLIDEDDPRSWATDPSHRPDSHRSIAERLPRYFMARARESGSATSAVMKEIISKCKKDRGSFRPRKDLLDLKNVPSETTLEEACQVVVREGMEKTAASVSNVMKFGAR